MWILGFLGCVIPLLFILLFDCPGACGRGSNGQEVRGWLCRNSPALLLDFLPQNSCQDVPFYAV